jgi:hypothetical protein
MNIVTNSGKELVVEILNGGIRINEKLFNLSFSFLGGYTLSTPIFHDSANFLTSIGVESSQVIGKIKSLEIAISKADGDAISTEVEAQKSEAKKAVVAAQNADAHIAQKNGREYWGNTIMY